MLLVDDDVNARLGHTAESMASGSVPAEFKDEVFEGLTGRSVEMRRVFGAIVQVAPSPITVLVTGETGTGKGLVAEAIHRRSTRGCGPFVKLHCAALPQSLLESELFGHERGAFTGAERRREGRFEAASGGTLFLDEVGELPLSVQTKLLRFLQDHKFERVGGNQTIHTDVRVIAATNRHLEQMVALGTFRADLFYRLNVVSIDMPPLRRRESDIPILARRLVEKLWRKCGSPCTLSDQALHVLRSHDWPGNVRELENAIQHALIFSNGNTIEPDDFPSSVVSANRWSYEPGFTGKTLAEIEQHAILATLDAVGGSRTKAARALGVSVRMIHYRLRQYAASRTTTQLPDSRHEALVDELPPSRRIPRVTRRARAESNFGVGVSEPRDPNAVRSL